MIRALEDHLAAWMKAQLELLAEQCGLFGPIRTLAGQLEPAFDPPLEDGEIGLAIGVTAFAPLPENDDLGGPSVSRWPTAYVRARMELRVLGGESALEAEPGREVEPAGAHVQRVDLAALALLALLREPSVPAPDIAGSATPGEGLGQRPEGAASAAQGTRKSQLSWTAIEPGDATVETDRAGNRRQWTIPLSAACTFRLSPVAPNGGRMLQIRQEPADPDSGRKSGDIASYAAAESIPLAYFDVLQAPTVAELGAYGVGTLGDLDRLGPSRMADIAARLRSATDPERARLGELTAMAVSRRSSAANQLPFRLEPELFALPAKALLAPTDAERAMLTRAVRTPGIADRIALLALPIIALLKPESRERVAFGTALTTSGGASGNGD